jgi:NAD-dependent deacetylase
LKGRHLPNMTTPRTLAADLAGRLATLDGPLLVLTGAGVSAASGIPTFRGTDPNAIWARDVMERATFGYFRRDPAGSWSWYLQRFAATTGARPNPAHTALVALENWQLARGGGFLLVTQNIDTLHEQAGSRDPIKVHGSADRARCAREGRCRNASRTVPLADLDFRAFLVNPHAGAVPRCDACGGPMRPHVLWFDELYTSHHDYRWPDVQAACARVRAVLAIGTSFSVGVTDFVRTAVAANRGVLFVVDPGARQAAVPGAVVIPEPAETLLPSVCELLGR